MSKNAQNDIDHDDAKAFAIPWVFSKDSQAKIYLSKYLIRYERTSCTSLCALTSEVIHTVSTNPTIFTGKGATVIHICTTEFPSITYVTFTLDIVSPIICETLSIGSTVQIITI